MKNATLKITLLCGCLIALNLPVLAIGSESNPACVLMKFTDDTRYRKVEAPATLSDMVMEKLIASGKFNLKETKPIDQNIETMLYEERAQEFANAEDAIANDNYGVLFEGPGFNEKKAQTISTAVVGQIVEPKFTAPIGEAHNAEYLIQGTILNLGTGSWWDQDAIKAASYASTAVSVLGGAGASSFLGPAGALASMLGNAKRTGIGVQADLRIIKAATGEVVWSDRVTSIADQKQYDLMGIKIGSDKLSNNLYAKAMELAAKNIVDNLTKQSAEKKIFVK